MKSTVIFGPPGCGKSTALIDIMKSTKGKSCFVSFTRAAAAEMTSRCKGMDFDISTIHSLAFRSAGITKDQVIGRDDFKKFASLTGFEITGSNPEEGELPQIGDFYLALYSMHRNKLRSELGDTYDHTVRDGSPEEFRFFVQKYEEFKKAYGLVDFTDMLELAHGTTINYENLFIDEAQDLSPLQWKLIEHWAADMKRVFVAGDDDQSIYVFGGADPAGMNKFAERYASGIKILDQSYRIPASVHTLATDLINQISKRQEKIYKPRTESGRVRKFDTVWNLNPITHGEDVLILYRNHSLRNDIERKLIESNIPYITDSGKPGVMQSYLARAVKALVACGKNFNAMHCSMATEAERRIMKKVFPGQSREIDADDFSFLNKKHWTDIAVGRYADINYLAEVEARYGLNVRPTIHLSSIHGSKGREAERVILINAMNARSAEALHNNPDGEIRVFYVGVTRAKHTLDIVFGDNPLPMLR